MKDSHQPPARRGPSLGWRLILSTALIIAVVMGGISIMQQLVDIREETAIYEDLLQVSLAPLATRLQSADSLTEMRELVKEFHEAHLGWGYAEHHVVLVDSAGSRVLSTLPPRTQARDGEVFRASLRIRSSIIRGGQGTLTVLKGNEEFRAEVRRDWLLWLVHVVSTVTVVSLFLGVATYYQVSRPVNRLIRGVAKNERGYWGTIDPGGAWEIRWLGWRFGNMAKEVRNSANRLSRAERKAWSLMSGRAGGGSSTGRSLMASTKDDGPDWTNSPEYRSLEALCERLETVSLTDSGAKALVRAASDEHALQAERLGFHELKARMEDATLRLTEPEAFEVLSERLAKLRAKWGPWAQRQRGVMLKSLERRGIPCTDILHRVKHTAGVRAKMRGKDLGLDEVHDLFAFRLIVPTESDCYAALGVIHELYEAEVSRFKDYITEPKENGYQALHTCVQSEGTPLFEVQIRSVAMDQHAERGRAVHWQYKAHQNLSLAETSLGMRWYDWWKGIRSRIFDR